MTLSHITYPRDRRKPAYIALHEQLRRELGDAKRVRKRRRSRRFKQTGSLHA